MKRPLLIAAIFSALVASPALAQDPTPRITVEPYIGYGFFGQLPGDTQAGMPNPNLAAGIGYGARAAYHLTPQWAVFGNFQRANPEVEGATVRLPGLDVQTGGTMTVDHWAAGVEFSYAPRGGAEGMLPLLLEAGLGQARYQGGHSDLAVKLGVSSAFRLTPNIGIRYGVDDYISNYGPHDGGVVNQFFARVGAEIRF